MLIHKPSVAGRERLAKQILEQALEIKAYDDWKNSFETLEPFKTNLEKNKKTKLYKSIKDTIENWQTCSFDEKRTALKQLSNQLCHYYKMPPIGIHDLSAWETLMKKTYKKTRNTHKSRTDSDGLFGAFFSTHTKPKSLNIIFSGKKMLDEEFFSVCHLFIHEIAHAIIYSERVRLKRSLGRYRKPWLHPTNFLNQPELKPIDTVALAALYLNESSDYQQYRERVFYEIEKEYETNKDNVKNSEAFKEYQMFWEERCCEMFAYHVTQIIKDAFKEEKQTSSNKT